MFLANFLPYYSYLSQKDCTFIQYLQLAFIWLSLFSLGRQISNTAAIDNWGSLTQLANVCTSSFVWFKAYLLLPEQVPPHSLVRVAFYVSLQYGKLPFLPLAST